MTTLARPPCANHPDRTAVALVHSGADLERYVCDICADRFWALEHVTGSVAATLSYL